MIKKKLIALVMITSVVWLSCSKETEIVYVEVAATPTVPAPVSGNIGMDHTNITWTANDSANFMTYSEGFFLGYKFTVSAQKQIKAVGAWEGTQAINSIPVAIYEDDVLLTIDTVTAAGTVIGNSRYVSINPVTLLPGKTYFVIANYEGNDVYGSIPTVFPASTYNALITPVTICQSAVFSRNTNANTGFPSNLTTLSDNCWSNQHFHVNFLVE